ANQPEMIGNIAASYLRKFATKKDADTTYGIRNEGEKFFIGDTEIDVNDNNIIVGDKEYEGSPGLWELIVMKTPDENIFTRKDYENYVQIMSNTNALRKGNNKDSRAPRSSKSAVVIIPSDPDALLERFDLLMASKAASNTGVRNEIVSICDELKRQNVL
ncbi:hypothetical protein CAPTEDRAFT_66092, partial [Capitella teleta]